MKGKFRFTQILVNVHMIMFFEERGYNDEICSLVKLINGKDFFVADTPSEIAELIRQAGNNSRQTDNNRETEIFNYLYRIETLLTEIKLSRK